MIDLISHATPVDTDTAAPAPGELGSGTSWSATETATATASPIPDARELLHRFATTGEQDPFEEVVRRYGGMVYNLCYEVTGNRQDAEDAVQAAFMSLALQVRAGQQIQAIGPWLQQVARRMSLDINRSRKRRKKREEKHGEAWEARQLDVRADGAGGAGAHGNPASAAGWDELRHIVQAELNEMPAKYRMPLILHYYGGMSREEMARELNCKTNTLGVRLHRGREMLGKRLAARGITLSSVMLGLVMAEVVHSVVSQRLIEHTAQAAVLVSSGHPFACGVVSPQIVALAHSAGRALANAKIKLAATLALMAGGAAAAGAQVVSHTGLWSNPAAAGSWDFRNALRWLFQRPDFLKGIRVDLSDGRPKPVEPKSPKTPTSPDTKHLAGAPNRVVPTPTFPLQPYDQPFAIKVPPLTLQGPLPTPALNYPPVPWAGQRDDGLPSASPIARTSNADRGVPFGFGAGGVRRGSGDDSDAADRTTPDAPPPPPDSAIADNDLDLNPLRRAPRTPRRVDPTPGNPLENQDLATRPKGPQAPVVPPANRGGGVQPQQPPINAPNRVNNGGGNPQTPSNNKPNTAPKPSGSPPAIPDTFDPGEIVHPTPTTPKSPSLPGPSEQQKLPTPQQPVPTPGKPTEDAGKVGEPTPQNPGTPTSHSPAAGETPSSGAQPQARGGFLSDGNLYVTTPYNPAGAETVDQLLAAGPGVAHFEIGPGATLVSKQVNVGHLGAGVASQTGGTHAVDSLYLGVTKTGRGQYALTGGELRVTASPAGPDAPVHSIDVGGAGEGTLLLGNATSTGRITQTADGGGVNLTVGVTRSGKGTLRGWGPVQLTGQLTNNGRIVADGFGQDRSLDLTTFASATNARPNVAAAGNGWYATNHGKLELPGLAVSKDNPVATWGQSAESTSLSYVNSARLTFTGVQTDGIVKIALLALDRTDLPTLPQGHHFIGTWSLDTGDLAATGGMDLLVRYDDALAAEKGLSENVLKLWRYVDGQWERLDHDPSFVRDPLNHTLSVHTDFGGVSHFAVSAPEPGSVGVLMILGGVWLGARRRRH